MLDEASHERVGILRSLEGPGANPTVLGGRYRLEELLGHGTLTAVYRARDQQLHRDVAVKLPLPHHIGDPDATRRLQREAQTHAGLRHPSIVALLEAGTDTELWPGAEVSYLVLELLAGTTMRQLLDSTGWLEIEVALWITGEVLAAVGYSHDHNIAHQDVSAANVMLDANGAVKLLDFGSAHTTGQSMMTQDMTATPEYVSPEHAQGLATDPRTDIYAVGCLLYQLLTGKPPFTGDSPVSLAYQHVHEMPVLPSRRRPEISPEIDAIVARALAKSRSARYQHAPEFAAALHAQTRRRPVA